MAPEPADARPPLGAGQAWRRSRLARLVLRDLRAARTCPERDTPSGYARRAFGKIGYGRLGRTDYDERVTLRVSLQSRRISFGTAMLATRADLAVPRLGATPISDRPEGQV